MLRLLVASIVVACAAAVGTTEWGPLSRGSWRSSFVSDSDEWTRNVATGVLSHTQHPFVQGSAYYGANIRSTDGHIHMVTKKGGLLYLTELSATGHIVKQTMINSEYTEVHSMLRYLPNGNPIFGSEEVLLSVSPTGTIKKWQANPSSNLPGPCGCQKKAVLSMLNSNPPQLVYADYQCVHAFQISDEGELDSTSYVKNCNFSTIMFNHDGTVFYNDAFWTRGSGAMGMIKSTSLPLTAGDGVYMEHGCGTLPWTAASDSSDNMYAACGYSWPPWYRLSTLIKFNKAGKQLWSVSSTDTVSVTLSDDESTLFVYHGTRQIRAVNPVNGASLWETTITSNCSMINGPFAPRAPIVQSKSVVWYCSMTSRTGTKYGQPFRMSLADGSMSKVGSIGDASPEIILADKNSLYIMSFFNTSGLTGTRVRKIHVGYA